MADHNMAIMTLNQYCFTTLTSSEKKLKLLGKIE